MVRAPFVEIDGTPYRDWWLDRFKTDPDPFQAVRFYRRGRSNIWAGSARIRALNGTRTDAVGLAFLRIGSRLWKPTTAAIVAFGSDSGDNLIDLERQEVPVFLAGGSLELEDDDARASLLSAGFIVVRYAGVAIGCGEWRRSIVHSCIPKGRRIDQIEM